MAKRSIRHLYAIAALAGLGALVPISASAMGMPSGSAFYLDDSVNPIKKGAEATTQITSGGGKGPEVVEAWKGAIN